MASIKRNSTFHMSEDRFDRVVFIATQVGYGEVVREKFFHTEDRGDYWRQITSTGVLIVRSADKSTVITVWLANVGQAKEVFNGAMLPQYLFNRIMKNRQFAKFM